MPGRMGTTRCYAADTPRNVANRERERKAQSAAVHRSWKPGTLLMHCKTKHRGLNQMYRSPENTAVAQTGQTDESRQRSGEISAIKHSSIALLIKRATDIVGALLFFTLFGGLFAICWLAVLISSGGPAIFTQPRYGRDGKVFRCYKFRSMVRNADAVLSMHLETDSAANSEWNIYQKLTDDPRVTTVGRWMRKYSLDELPQVWNVLIGEMSFVGPRPCMQGQAELYGCHWAEYCAMRPGITGLWQVSGRNKLGYSERVALDAAYVNGWSLWLDFKILAKTVYVVATGHGSH